MSFAARSAGSCSVLPPLLKRTPGPGLARIRSARRDFPALVSYAGARSNTKRLKMKYGRGILCPCRLFGIKLARQQCRPPWTSPGRHWE
jgi:hypothetical protein